MIKNRYILQYFNDAMLLHDILNLPVITYIYEQK